MPNDARAAAAPLVRLAALSVDFGPVAALRDVDLALRRGEVLAVVGANGSGKTTLLRALHGLIAFRGRRDLLDPEAVASMVFQRPFMLGVSVWNNLRVALWLARAPGADRPRLALEALERVGLANRRSRPAKALSGGEQQRLALARAWALRPDLLLLDEPTANLDPTAKREIEQLLAGFAADGMTLVIATHNLGQAKRLATRVVYLDRGEIRVDLPVERFFDELADERANLFLKGDLSWDLE